MASGSSGGGGLTELTAGYEHDNLGKPVQQNLLANPGLSYEEVLNDDFQFDMNAHDVMVFLHIQKTGGTSFGKHLVRDLDLKVSTGGEPFIVTFGVRSGGERYEFKVANPPLPCGGMGLFQTALCIVFQRENSISNQPFQKRKQLPPW